MAKRLGIKICFNEVNLDESLRRREYPALVGHISIAFEEPSNNFYTNVRVQNAIRKFLKKVGANEKVDYLEKVRQGRFTGMEIGKALMTYAVPEKIGLFGYFFPVTHNPRYGHFSEPLKGKGIGTAMELLFLMKAKKAFPGIKYVLHKAMSKEKEVAMIRQGRMSLEADPFMQKKGLEVLNPINREIRLLREFQKKQEKKYKTMKQGRRRKRMKKKRKSRKKAAKPKKRT